MTRLASILLFLLSAIAFAWPDVSISRSEYAQIRDISLQLLDKYPAKEYFILAPGRSATPFVSFISELEQGRIASFPLSHFRSPHAYEREAAVRAEFKRRLDPVFAPKNAKPPAQKKILVTDYTGTGYSLIGAVNAIEGYIKDNGLNYKVETLALVSGDQTKVERVKNAFAEYKRPVELFSLSKHKTVEGRILRQDYDGYAGFGSSPIYVPLKEHEEFKKLNRAFREALQKHMKYDPYLFIRSCAKRLTE